jgi:hypothetical protein
MSFISPLTILVHYKAFGSDQIFPFTYVPDHIDLSDLNELDLLELIFTECNRSLGTEWIGNKNYRSMSVDDEIIVVNNKKSTVERFKVASVGFEKISNIP